MATKYEMSKTYQYRKVMKPLLERKRRARINKCLDDLKDILAEVMIQQQQNKATDNEDNSPKFEKADILELTVQHLRNLKMQRQQQQQQRPPIVNGQHSFRYGYIQAANEVSRCLATLPKINVEFGTKLMTHLGLRLNQLESCDEEKSHCRISTAPLSINCNTAPLNAFQRQSSSYSSSTLPAMYSPVSSGYASDYESSNNPSPAPAHSHSTYAHGHVSNNSKGLLQVAAPVWRPW